MFSLLKEAALSPSSFECVMVVIIAIILIMFFNPLFSSLFKYLNSFESQAKHKISSFLHEIFMFRRDKKPKQL